VRERVGSDRFVEVFVDTDPALCRERRPDGDHAGFEAPDRPDLTISMNESRVEHAVDHIIELLAKRRQVDLE
jgi:adenylylsulfate kinase-like enzyme